MWEIGQVDLPKRVGLFIGFKGVINMQERQHWRLRNWTTLMLRQWEPAKQTWTYRIDRKWQATVNSGVPFILDNETLSLLMNALDQMHSRKAHIVVVTDCK